LELKQEESKSNNNNKSSITPCYWMQKYKSQEMDAKRQHITVDELNDLTFDFRYWIGTPTVVDGRIIVQSGLLESASHHLRFETTNNVDNDNNDERQTNEWWSTQGIIRGHPSSLNNTDSDIEWFLNEETGRIQWGFVPHLWPEGYVKRLDSWGWEIRNCNVVMRAVDAAKGEFSNNKEGKKDDDSNGLSLWNDLLDDLENVPMRNNPTVNGFLVTAEIPRSYFDSFSAVTR
jgi:hypothetical protein